MARQIILDTETTGIQVAQGHRIIEIGCIEMIDRRLTDQQFHCYLNPEREVEEGAEAVHGLSTAFLADKPLFVDIVDDFMAFIQGAELLIHNAPFDVSFINQELKLAKRSYKTLDQYCRIVDTLLLARQLHAGQKNSLDALCKRYGVNNAHRDYHGALLDAHLLAQVYLSMTEGQRRLFDEWDQRQSDDLKPEGLSINAAREKIVLLASAEEEALHQEYLQKMKKQGKCLWADWRDG